MAAATRISGCAEDGQQAGNPDILDVAANHPRKHDSSGGSCGNADACNHSAFSEDAGQQMPRRRPNREADAELARPRAHRERQHARDADDGDEQCDCGESAEDERVQPIRREHLRAHVLECRGLLHGLIRRQLANDPPDGRDQRIRIRACVNEQAATANLLLERVIDVQRRAWHHILIIDVGGDSDDPARLGADVYELHHRIGPHQAAVHRVLVGETSAARDSGSR